MENGKTRTLFPAQPCEWTYTSPLLLKTNLQHLGRCFFTRSPKCDTQTQTGFPQRKDASWHLTISDLSLFNELGFWQVHILKYTVQISLRNKDLASDPKLRVLSGPTKAAGTLWVRYGSLCDMSLQGKGEAIFNALKNLHLLNYIHLTHSNDHYPAPAMTSFQGTSKYLATLAPLLLCDNQHYPRVWLPHLIYTKQAWSFSAPTLAGIHNADHTVDFTGRNPKAWGWCGCMLGS